MASESVADLNRYNRGRAVNKYSRYLLLSLICISASANAFNYGNFEKEVTKTGKTYNEYASRMETKQLSMEGNVSAYNARLENLVPDSKKSVYDYFVLGNMLFITDHKASYRYMIKAENMAPDNPFIQYERGIHEHRLGHYNKAIEYYKKVQQTKSGKDNPVLYAYLTHAYLMTGKVNKAFGAWGEADFHQHHTSIEKGMYAIFSRKNQEHERENLISRINAGDLSELCNLYELDSHWEIDWWNTRPRKSYLAFDGKLAGKVLTGRSRQARYYKFCSSDKKLSNAEYLERLNQLGILGKENRLPESSTLIYRILRRLISSKQITPLEFLNKFELQLKKYAKQHPLDRKYYDILAFLYSQTDKHDKLKAIDIYGWKKLKLEEYASSYVAGIDPKSKLFRKTLTEALTEFPLSATLNKFNVADNPKNKKSAMIRFVASQFANVKNNWSGPYRLSDYMASLHYELGKID